MDVTYIPMARDWVYLFRVETPEDAPARHGKPEVVNTDQGSQFTGQAFTSVLANNGIAMSVDSKGAWRDNVFVERLWRCVKYSNMREV
jgi:putative transposase